MLLAAAAAEDLIMEGGDVCNAYLYGDIDMEVIIEHLMNYSGVYEKPVFACRLSKSMYGIRQAGQIWGSLLVKTILSWNFTKSTADARVLIKKEVLNVVITPTVVDDMVFFSNSKQMLDEFKSPLRESVDVKLFSVLREFIGWEISRDPEGIKITQAHYAKQVLAIHGLSQANGKMDSTSN